MFVKPVNVLTSLRMACVALIRKKRFFVLKENCLFYYKNADDMTLLGVMPVQSSRLYDFSGESTQPPPFLDSPVQPQQSLPR